MTIDAVWFSDFVYAFDVDGQFGILPVLTYNGTWTISPGRSSPLSNTGTISKWGGVVIDQLPSGSKHTVTFSGADGGSAKRPFVGSDVTNEALGTPGPYGFVIGNYLYGEVEEDDFPSWSESFIIEYANYVGGSYVRRGLLVVNLGPPSGFNWKVSTDTFGLENKRWYIQLPDNPGTLYVR